MEKEHHHIDADISDASTSNRDNNTSKHADSSTTELSSGPIGNLKNEETVKQQVVGGSVVNVRHVYRQDVVRSNKDDGLIGMVIEVAGELDSDSDITDDDEEDDDDDSEENNENENTNQNKNVNESEGEGGGDDCDDDGDDDGDDDDDDYGNEGKGGGEKSDPLPADQIRVMWMNHSETTQNISDVTVIDRGFLHGDIVASASDPTGQVGIVVDVDILVDLKTADGSIIKDVPSRDLKRVRDFTVGDYIVRGHWLGRVEDVLDNVTVLFDDGSICKVMKADPLRLKPIDKNIIEDGQFPYYPGQRVKATSSSVFKSGKWLSGSWKASRKEGIVTKVTVGSVFIYWIASASSGFGSEAATTPAEEQSPKNLKLLACFAHANWQVGDWCLLSTYEPSTSLLDEKVSQTTKCDEPVQGGSVSDDPGSDHGSEKYEGNNEFMELDTTFSPDANNDSVESSDSPKSGSSNISLHVSKDPTREGWPIHRKRLRKVVVKRDKKVRRKEDNFERAVVIANTKTKVDVAWQNGKTECGLVSTTLIPIDSPGDHEFFAEQYVVERISDEDDDVSSGVRRVGVVKSVDAKERTAIVRWLKPVARPEDPREFDKDEVVSVYELEGHPDYDYCHGDVVVRLSPVSAAAQTGSSGDTVEEPDQQVDSKGTKEDVDKHLRQKKEEDQSNNEPDKDFSDLSWVGNITGLREGDIEVTWADGMVSTVGPQAIYVVGRDDDDEDSIGGGSDVSDAVSWETVDEDQMGAPDNAEEEVSQQNATDVNSEAETTVQSEENDSQNGPLSISLAALGFITRLATGIFSRGRKQIDPLSSDSTGENNQNSIDSPKRRAPSNESSSSLESHPADSCGEQTNIGEHGSLSEDMDDIKVEVLCSLRSETNSLAVTEHCGEDPCSFKHFDTAENPIDHHFFDESGQNSNGRKWLKKVQQDWNILQKNLPDDIYVRVYEDRMDLIRAVIVGPYGTPYQDGLFVFDFHLPPEYPQVPPSVYYHSGGWRINPNLYEEGKVCLSLLNTWTGRGNEVWDPSSSSILQVLVSLQGLVLNSRPYFNEAGYDKQVGTAEGEKNSLSYNENTFLLNCKSMMYLMRKPPKDFGELIKAHFRRRGYYILKACDAYNKGYMIGSLTNDASITDKSNDDSASVGFKLMLAKLMPKLITALTEVGADCDEFKHLQDSH